MMTKKQAAARLGVSMSTLNRLITKHNLPKYGREGHRGIFLREDDIIQFAKYKEIK
jgi:hypothetical protein